MNTRTQVEISKILEITQAMVSQIMNGRRSVTWAMAKKLSENFGRSPAWWMEADIAKIRRVLRGAKTDGSKQGGQYGKEQRRAA